MMESIVFYGLLVAIAVLWIQQWLLRRQWRKERSGMEAYKQWLAKKAGENVEQRCQHCKAGRSCPGYSTGVTYPCDYYEEEEHGTEE